MSNDERTGINWVQVIAAALAAVSSAVVLSTLGVAGTIIGAALGSVTASIGAAVYSRTIDASRQQVAAQAAALKRVTHARRQVDDAVLAMQGGSARSDTGVLRARARLGEAEQALADAEAHVERSTEAGGPTGGPLDESQTFGADEGSRQNGDPLFHAEAGKRLPWKRVALVAAGVFLVAMIAITGFELLTGRAVSSLTGGSDRSTSSTVPGLGHGSRTHASSPTPAPSSQPSESAQPTPSESDSPSSSTVPTPTPSPSPTETPFSSGTPTPTPSPSVPVG